MKKGFLVIDGHYNTLFIPAESFLEFGKHFDMRMDFINDIHIHKTRAELNKEITDYIKMRGYYNE